jgi:hypothetical protein
MSCSGITADILNNCATNLPVGGLEVNVVLINRTDKSVVTYKTGDETTIEDIVLKVGKKGYLHTGFNKGIDGGFSAVADEKMPNYYKHTLNFEVWGIDASTNAQINQLFDVFAIVESKNKTGEGTFQILGFKNGLKVVKDDKMFNANMGKRLISLESIDNEPIAQYTFFKTDYAATKVLIDSLLVEQA